MPSSASSARWSRTTDLHQFRLESLDLAKCGMHNPRSGAAPHDQAGQATQSVDPTEETRRALLVTVNTTPADRTELEAHHGQVWSTDELARDFEVLGFAAPFVVVRRRTDGRAGSLMFQHHPRFYFAFEVDHE